MSNVKDNSELQELVEELQAQAQSTKNEIASLHHVFEKKGVNSKGTTDIFGRRFSVPVDAEHKATAMPIFNFSNPHMRAFHASWFGFFATFFSTFAAAPLVSDLWFEPTSLAASTAAIPSLVDESLRTSRLTPAVRFGVLPLALQPHPWLAVPPWRAAVPRSCLGPGRAHRAVASPRLRFRTSSRA